tara:strand:+ start:1819 stop:2454 length:636 start_codon:yes stop_codon:yes gene_type:complete
MLKVAIVDYGMGNIFSVNSACKKAGIETIITQDHDKILSSNALILPGVGSFFEAMKRIKDKKLDVTIKEFYKTKKPIVGICLGMQLLFSESEEQKKTKGLNLIQGKVRSIGKNLIKEKSNYLNIGWYTISQKKKTDYLKNLKKEKKMYFIHSYYCIPDDNRIITSFSTINDMKFCSSISHDNIECFQFHPEKSGVIGQTIYSCLNKKIKGN